MERPPLEDLATTRRLGAETGRRAATDGRKLDGTAARAQTYGCFLGPAGDVAGLVGARIYRAANLHAAEIPGPLAQAGAAAAVRQRAVVRLYPLRRAGRLQPVAAGAAVLEPRYIYLPRRYLVDKKNRCRINTSRRVCKEKTR